MNKKLSRTNRNYIIMGLCAILLIMGIGYAAFQSQLKISGTSNIASNFLVKITGIEVSSKSGGAADKPDVTTYNDTSATFGTTLQSPGDSITYDITIENQGTMDAILKTISKTDASNSAILFETSGVNEGDPLNVGENAIMQVKVTYNSSVTSQPDDLDSTLKVDLTYEQSESVVTPPEPSGMTPEDLKELVVTHGDGLYADEYEDGRYFYKGTNPNNYITFNNETWRILSVEADGTLKIVKNDLLVGDRWDSSAINSWNRPATLNTYLNETYFASLLDKEKVVNHLWNVGAINYKEADMATQLAQESGVNSSGQVGLITVSEYIRANSNIEQCGTFEKEENNYTTCVNTNWLYKAGYYWWVITPFSGTSSHVFRLRDDGRFDYAGASASYDIRPTLYLISSIILSGDGSQSNPYVITN